MIPSIAEVNFKALLRKGFAVFDGRIAGPVNTPIPRYSCCWKVRRLGVKYLRSQSRNGGISGAGL